MCTQSAPDADVDGTAAAPGRRPWEERLLDDTGFGSNLPSLVGASTFSGGWPNVEISDGEKEIKVTAEVPGLEEKDIEVLLDDGVLTLKGEKRSETEDKDRQFSERFYGRFERRIPLGYEVKDDQVDARFRNGVLTVTIPVSPKSQPRKIQVATGQEHHDNVVLEHDKGSDEDRSQNVQKDSEGSQD